MDVHFGYPLGLNAILLSTTSLLAMYIPQQAKKTILKNQLIGLACLIVLVEFCRTMGLILYSEYTITIDYRSSVLSIVATMAFWFVVAFILDRWIFTDHSNIAF